jgi:hypothetical protein
MFDLACDVTPAGRQIALLGLILVIIGVAYFFFVSDVLRYNGEIHRGKQSLPRLMRTGV